MGMRAYLNENPGIAGGVVLVGLLVALGWLWWASGSAASSAPETYFVDLETGELFIERFNGGAPPPSPQGNPSARARVYTCNGCEPGSVFLGRAERAPGQAGATGDEGWEPVEVSRDLETWTLVRSEEGLVEQWEPQPCPDGSQPAPCRSGEP